MKVFVSWSGARSKAVAELISDWIKCVLQASQPWISTRDIDKGAIWFSEISDQLKDTAAGIVCLTQENKDKPWILFETGALAKGITTNRVCTFLIDLEPADIEDPLAQFNHTFADRSSMWGLICSLNSCLDSSRLDERVLRQVFDTYWPQFESGFANALKGTPEKEKAEPRSEQSILAEILANTRALGSRVRELELKASTSATMLKPNGARDEVSALLEVMSAGASPQRVLAVAESLGVSMEDADALIKDRMYIGPDMKKMMIRNSQRTKKDGDQ